MKLLAFALGIWYDDSVLGASFGIQIWSFKMKAACCKQEIEIQTDPKNCEYVVVSGAEKKTEDYDEVDAETVLLPAAEGVPYVN
jgi:coiled-coil domain-containing protein 130